MSIYEWLALLINVLTLAIQLIGWRYSGTQPFGPIPEKKLRHSEGRGKK